jgi:hypothetical protein
MVFMIVLGADLMNTFAGAVALPQELARWVIAAWVGALPVLSSSRPSWRLYVLLGCVMD